MIEGLNAKRSPCSRGHNKRYVTQKRGFQAQTVCVNRDRIVRDGEKIRVWELECELELRAMSRQWSMLIEGLRGELANQSASR